MQYVNKTFTLPTTTKRMTDREYEIAVGLRPSDEQIMKTQTDYEIGVGLRHPDGTLVQPRRKKDSRFANPEWIAKNDSGRP